MYYGVHTLSCSGLHTWFHCLYTCSCVIPAVTCFVLPRIQDSRTTQHMWGGAGDCTWVSYLSSSTIPSRVFALLGLVTPMLALSPTFSSIYFCQKGPFHYLVWFIFSLQQSFSISCKTSLVVINSFSFSLRKTLLHCSPSFLSDNLLGQCAWLEGCSLPSAFWICSDSDLTFLLKICRRFHRVLFYIITCCFLSHCFSEFRQLQCIVPRCESLWFISLRNVCPGCRFPADWKTFCHYFSS